MKRIGRFVDIASLGIVLGALIVFCTGYAARKAGLNAFADPGRIPEAILRASMNGHRLGDANAPVNVLVFWNYVCSFCREFDEPLQEIHRRYPEHVTIVFKHFVKSSADPGYMHAVAAECAGKQGRFDDYHAAVVQTAGSYLNTRSAWLTVGQGIDIPDRRGFEICVKSAATRTVIMRDYEDAESLNVVSTPTFYVNGSRYEGSVSLSSLDSIIVRHMPRRRQ